MRLAQATSERRYGNGRVVPREMLSSSLIAKRRGKWKKSSAPIDRVSFVAPPDWTTENDGDKSCVITGPGSESSYAPAISIEVIEGPDDARECYEQLLIQRQAQPKFMLIDGGVVTRDRGLQAAHLRYTFDSDGVQTTVRELSSPSGFALSLSPRRCAPPSSAPATPRRSMRCSTA